MRRPLPFASVGITQSQRRHFNVLRGTVPTADVIRKVAVALRVSAGVSIFGEDKRGSDEELRLQFEAISKFDTDEKRVIKALLGGMILKREAKRCSSSR